MNVIELLRNCLLHYTTVLGQLIVIFDTVTKQSILTTQKISEPHTDILSLQNEQTKQCLCFTNRDLLPK